MSLSLFHIQIYEKGPFSCMCVCVCLFFLFWPVGGGGLEHEPKGVPQHCFTNRLPVLLKSMGPLKINNSVKMKEKKKSVFTIIEIYPFDFLLDEQVAPPPFDSPEV